jgi:hypothetical protein
MIMAAFFWGFWGLGVGRSVSAAAGPSSRRFAVPSAATSCRSDRSGTAIHGLPELPVASLRLAPGTTSPPQRCE